MKDSEKKERLWSNTKERDDVRLPLPSEISDKKERRQKRGSFFAKIRRFFTSRQNAAFSFSLLFHVALALILLSIALTIDSDVGLLGNSIFSGFTPEIADVGFLDGEEDVNELEAAMKIESEFDKALEANPTKNFDSNDSSETLESVLAETTPTVEALNGAQSSPDASDASGGIPFYSSKGTTSGRAQAKRKKGVEGREGDVTDASEDAVERGLDWLARHQLPDGGWTFDLTALDSNDRAGSCDGCSNSESTSGGSEYRKSLFPNRTAATAIALLPFLGAGYVHTQESKYQKTIAAGLRYLEYRARSTENGVDFRDGFAQDGAAYIQALVVLTFCEAYELTSDSNLKGLAQGGVDFIQNSQLSKGGWRYYSPGDFDFHPNVDGDTSVLGWQMLALKSGISAGLSVRPSVAYQAGNFLDSVMSKDAKSYRYQPKTNEDVDKTKGTTAVGVLIREYLGWEPGFKRLDAGAEQLAEWLDDAESDWQKAKKGSKKKKNVPLVVDGRLVHNLYFSYYAALALHHYGGKLWQERFPKLRDFLVETQSRGGVAGLSCERGSWLFYDQYMNDGGRLLNTALAILILETPYRYLPMYK